MSRNDTKLKGEAMLQHADALERETRLLRDKGYFGKDGRPIGGEAGKRIWAEVQAELRNPTKAQCSIQ